jgi:quinol monooxygenase YgiN
VREHARRSLGEAGCLRFDILQDASDPATICLYEVFRSELDLAVHRSQPYYAEWMTRSRDWRDSTSYSRRVLRNLYPPDDEWMVRS